MKKWRCTVCGYIHTGDEPPEKCPVCGADKSKFVPLEKGEEFQAKAAEAQAGKSGIAYAETGSKKSQLIEVATDLMTRYHAHPISVHIPNGVLPAAVLFLFLAMLFNISGLRLAAYYNLWFVVLAMPFVLFSGYNDWQRRLGGNMTNTILAKIICGGIVLLLTVVLVVWRIADPQVAEPVSAHRWTYFLLHLVALGTAGLAGFLGGKLVFKTD